MNVLKAPSSPPAVSDNNNASHRRLLQLCGTTSRALRLGPVLTTSSSLQQIVEPSYTKVYEDDDVPYPLTKSECFSFLENILKISRPREYIERDRLGFLNAFIEGMNKEIPFSNFGFVSTPLGSSRRCPTFAECKEDIFNRYGGNCFYINIFTKALLDQVGYNTFHIGGNNIGDYHHDSHVSTIACDVTHPGSLHLVDPGTIRPLYSSIPLDFEMGSEVYQFDHMKIKFFKRNPGILLWCAAMPDGYDGKPTNNIIESEGEFWKVQIIYRMNKRLNRSYFLEQFNLKYRFPSYVPEIHQHFILAGYTKGRSLTIVSSKDILVARFHHKDPSQEETWLITDEQDLFDLIKVHFPQYPQAMLSAALDNARFACQGINPCMPLFNDRFKMTR